MKTYEELFKIVSEKGYMSLSVEDRELYSKLKEDNKKKGFFTKKKVGKEVKEEEPREKMVTLTQGELQAMLDKAAAKPGHVDKPEVQPYNEWEEVAPEDRPNKRGKLRMYREDAEHPWGVIVRADYLKTVFNEETRRHDKLIYKIEVLYDDDDRKEYEIEAEEYIKLNQREDVELVETHRKPMRKVSGKVAIPKRDKDGYPMIAADGGAYGGNLGNNGETTLEVLKYDEVFIVKRPNGQTFKLHSKYLNA